MKAIHPHPWTASEGTIREVNGYVIGNYAYTLGDHLDHNSGELPKCESVALSCFCKFQML